MIRPTFLGFETAKRALTIGQLGLDTVGHNISNASTPGYTRQRVDQVSIASSGYRMKYQTFGSQFPGQGADVSGINQIRDPYLDKRYRAQATTYGELSVKNDGLIDINNILDEITTDGLHAKISDLIGRLDILAQQADSPDMATVVRNTANELMQLFNLSARAFDTARSQQVNDLNVAVAQNVNNIIEQIADLNVKIKEDNFYGNPSLELNDTRNLLLDQLSEYLDIKIVKTPVKIATDLIIERVSVELNNSGTPPIVLIDSGAYNKLGVKENESTGKVSIHLIDGISGFPIVPDDITGKMLAGGVKGFIDLINGEGPIVGASYAGGNTFRGFPYYKEALDDLARTFASVMNTINSVSAEEATASGNPPMIEEAMKNLFVSVAPTIASRTGNSDWIGGFQPGTLGLSSGIYDIEFIMGAGTPPAEVYADVVIDGQTVRYTAQSSNPPGTELKFIGDDGSVAFTVANKGAEPAAATIKLDARITADNIAISQNWLADPLFITATKLNPVTKARLSSDDLPDHISSIEIGAVAIPNDSTIEFDYSAGPPEEITALIDGITYRGAYTPDGTIELKDVSGNIGLIVKTNAETPAAVPITSNITATNVTAAANDNILKFKVAFTGSYEFANGIKGTFQEYLVSLEGDDAALDLNLNETLLKTSETVIGQYADRRDAISAVSADEEAINMMTYQNYYNAAARYMTTLDEALDKIINGMGIVGR